MNKDKETQELLDSGFISIVEQVEPVAWQERQAKRMSDGVVTEWTNWYPCRYRTIDEARAEACDHIPYEWRPLYTHPPVPTAQPKEPEQEPVARPCHVFNVHKNGALTEWEPTTMAFALSDGTHALYTIPPQKRKPLNEVKLKSLWKRITHSEDCACPTFHAFSLGFRTAESTHGIKE